MAGRLPLTLTWQASCHQGCPALRCLSRLQLLGCNPGLPLGTEAVIKRHGLCLSFKLLPNKKNCTRQCMNTWMFCCNSKCKQCPEGLTAWLSSTATLNIGLCSG